METSVQLGQNFPVHAYLSYRCKNPQDIAARDKLQNLCKQQNISLRFDENQTEQGDSLIEFMEDLTAARCVFLFLSPDYFQSSAYTLFELICIHENADLNQRFILPLRLTESMVTYVWTDAKLYFEGNNKVQNELIRLLKKYNFNTDNLWQRIDAAWNAIIFPHLDILNGALENQHNALEALLGKTKTAISQAITQSTKTLRDTLVSKISAILNRKHINADDQLRAELSLRANDNTDKIASHLVEKTEVGEAIAILTRVLEEKKVLLDANEWKACFFDAEQLCGWLILNSVDPTWWFHNEKKLDKTTKTSISGSIALHDKNYIEVVISRCFEKAARYILDSNKQPKPAGNKNDVMCFDASTPKAKIDELLTSIYKDLFGVEPSKDIDILKKVIARAKTNYKNQQKPVYYLVTADYLAMWESVAKDFSDEDVKELAGCMQFICCDKPAKPNERQASIEDQTQLLDQIAYFLSLQH